MLQHAVVLATGGYGTIYYMSTLAVNSNASAAWKAHKKGAFLCQSKFHTNTPYLCSQLHDFQAKLTLMSESLRNDGRVWVPKNKGDKRPANSIPRRKGIITWNADILLSVTLFEGCCLKGSKGTLRCRFWCGGNRTCC